ncbi:MAG: DNA mismatch repair endonuclease MutL [Deltaproteobacteria bacterium]|jgi:DNA mismatch repair protein MutL|nr:DNA mismatch repair endonuclease MutL [Deltaproteobacteria bacterium]
MISRIKLLPDHLINRIAAGEVVERPSSILKELAENSLDAGANRLEIDIADGGKKLVRISDNGSGLSREELFLCLERHATSKLDETSDLSSILTLGFRGEALSSIASVSKLSITSSTGESEGHKIRVEGGRVIDLSPAPANKGTIVEVRDLFYNVPARRKFLKSQATETAHLVEVAQRYALSRTDLRLKLSDEQKEIVNVDEKSDMTSRILKIFGRDVASGLIPFVKETDDLRIRGWLADPQAATRLNSSLFLYVLARPVRDRLLTRAVIQGYGHALPQGRWPAGVIFIDLDPSKVDVNVHPAKTEVRFLNPSEIFDVISQSVKEAIDVSPLNINFRSLPKGDAAQTNAPDGNRNSYINLSFSMGKPAKQPLYSQSQPQSQPPLPPPPWLNENENASLINQFTGSGSEEIKQQAPAGDSAPPSPAASPLQAQSASGSASASSSESAPGSDKASCELMAQSRLIAQLLDSYILVQGPLGLYIIDQHAAHERVLFNYLKKNLIKSGLASQGLLYPQTMELGPHEAIAAERLAKPLEHLGFQLEPFGGATWALRGIPSLLKPNVAKDALLEMLSSAKSRLRTLEGAGLELMLSELSESWLYSIACRAAVKAGDKMEDQEMESLIKDLSQTDAGGYCPHGRPSTILITTTELEQRFKRI